jgi:rubrerythrin
MENDERLSALEVALNNETRERDFYLKNAARTQNPVGRAMFDRIAQDEREHYERLKTLHEEWVRSAKWPETVPLTINQTNVRDILLATLKNVDKAEPCDPSDREAIRIAAEFEEKGVIFYKDLAASSTDERERAFFELLSFIEYEHYLSLRDAEEYFENPAAWYVKKEHPMWDGG